MSSKPHTTATTRRRTTPSRAERLTVATATIWLEAEAFQEYGGWCNDSQFMETVGSPYLLAAGVGKPVADAVTDFHAPKADTYHLWVRCKDWRPEHSPGKFEVLINGVASPTLFGKADDDQWRWIDGGTFELTAGDNEIRLHDLTGWWGRCDAVVLTSDQDFTPSNEISLLNEQRIQHGAASATARELGYFDVVVAGGGLAGSLAAIAAAREGAKVALIQDRPVLGGNGSSEIQVPVMGDLTYEPWDPRETGLLEEVLPSGAGHGPWSTNLERMARAEPNLKLWFNTRLTSVDMQTAQVIDAIEAVDTTTGERLKFQGDTFIDCTGDASLGYLAGADFRHGQEARSEYNEPAAPEKPDRYTQSSSLNAGRFASHSKEIEMPCPPWAYQWESEDDFHSASQGAVWNDSFRVAKFDDVSLGKGRHPQNANAPIREWYVEFGGRHDTIADAEWIRDELFRINIGIWNYIKNWHPEYREQNKNRELVWLNYIVGKRESRRLLGDYVVGQNDFINNTTYPDTVAYAGWVMDLHHPCGFFSPGPQAHLEHMGRAAIPFRSLYSRNIDNLMMAGRNISVTHLGLAKTRVMRTCALFGWAAGLGAALASLRGVTPRVVASEYIHELQQKILKSGGYLPGVVEQDSENFAHNAKASASSSALIQDPSYLVALPNYFWKAQHPLTTGLSTQFLASEEKIESVSLFLRSKRKDSVTLPLSFHSARFGGDLACDELLATAQAELPAGFEGWVEFPLQYQTTPGEWYVIALPKTDNAFWDLYSHHPPETFRGYETPPAWSCEWGCHKFKLNPGGEPDASVFIQQHGMNIPFTPENALNGVSRAIEGAPNSWAPDPALPLPQWLALELPETKKFNTIYLYFQMRMLAPRGYSIQTFLNNQWETIIQVADNDSRRRVHRFPTVEASRVRVVIEERSQASDLPLTPICEIRLYNE